MQEKITPLFEWEPKYNTFFQFSRVLKYCLFPN